MAQSNVFNCDCVEYMKTLPDNFFDLCIADPPYGDATKDKIGGGYFQGRTKVRGEIQEILPTNWKRFSGGTWAERYRKPIMPTEGDSPDTPAWGGGGRNTQMGCRARRRVFQGNVSRVAQSDYMGR